MIAPAQNNEKLNVIYPSDPLNYLQQADLVRRDPKDLYRDFKGNRENMEEVFSQTQKPLNARELLDGDSLKASEMLVNKEQEIYDQQLYDFSAEKQKKTENKQFTDLQRYMSMRQGWADSQLAGIEYDNTPRIRVWNTLM